jgi:hypothetical protein
LEALPPAAGLPPIDDRPLPGSPLEGELSDADLDRPAGPRHVVRCARTDVEVAEADGEIAQAGHADQDEYAD